MTKQLSRLLRTALCAGLMMLATGATAQGLSCPPDSYPTKCLEGGETFRNGIHFVHSPVCHFPCPPGWELDRKSETCNLPCPREFNTLTPLSDPTCNKPGTRLAMTCPSDMTDGGVMCIKKPAFRRQVMGAKQCVSRQSLAGKVVAYPNMAPSPLYLAVDGQGTVYRFGTQEMASQCGYSWKDIVVLDGAHMTALMKLGHPPPWIDSVQACHALRNKYGI